MGHLGPSWRRLGAYLARLGASLARQGAILSRLGAILGRLGRNLGPSWPSWGVLGRSWPPKNRLTRGQKTLIFLCFFDVFAFPGLLGAMLPQHGLFGRLGTFLGASWGYLGASRVRLGASCGRLGASWGKLGLPKPVNERPKNIDFPWFFQGFRVPRPPCGDLAPTWPLWPSPNRLGRILGPSWCLLGASWRVLGPSWGVLAAQNLPKSTPKRSQNRSKNRSKIDA